MLEREGAEIRLRARRRVGELSAALETSKGGANPAATLSSVGKSKRATLDAAGLSVTEAHRCEQIEFVRWWDENIRGKGRISNSADPRYLVDDAESLTGITHQQVSKWRRAYLPIGNQCSPLEL